MTLAIAAIALLRLGEVGPVPKVPRFSLPFKAAYSFIVNEGSKLPLGGLVISEDGKRCFGRSGTGVLQGDSLSAFEFASEVSWTAPTVEFRSAGKPFITTMRQWRDLEGFNSSVIKARHLQGVMPCGSGALAADRFDNVTVFHGTNAAVAGGSNATPLAGVSIVNIDTLHISSNKLVGFGSDWRGAIAARDQGAFLVNRATLGWQLLATSGRLTSISPLSRGWTPVHLDVGANILMCVANNELCITKLKGTRYLVPLGMPKGIGESHKVGETVLLPNGRALASFALARGADARLFQWNSKSWRYVGPYEILGASNTGKIVLVRLAESSTSFLIRLS